MTRILATLIALVTFLVAGCTDHEIAVFKTLTPDQQGAVLRWLGAPEGHSGGGVGVFLECVKHHESRGDYRADNPSPRSTASGAYGYIDGTWRNVSRSAGHPGYPTAASAPAWVQDAVAVHTVRTVGRSPWAGTGC